MQIRLYGFSILTIRCHISYTSVTFLILFSDLCSNLTYYRIFNGLLRWNRLIKFNAHSAIKGDYCLTWFHEKSLTSWVFYLTCWIYGDSILVVHSVIHWNPYINGLSNILLLFSVRRTTGVMLIHRQYGEMFGLLSTVLRRNRQCLMFDGSSGMD
jgi:hypothetical protein